MVRKMRDLDQGYDYEVLDKKTKMLRKHRFFSLPGAKRKRGVCCCWPIVTLLVVSWILFLILWMYSRSIGINIFTTVTKIQSYPANLVRIPAELANKKGAFCLDGTVPSYYIRKGKH